MKVTLNVYVWGEESAPLNSRAAHRHAATTLATYEVEREERREGREVKGKKRSGVGWGELHGLEGKREGEREGGWMEKGWKIGRIVRKTRQGRW